MGSEMCIRDRSKEICKLEDGERQDGFANTMGLLPHSNWLMLVYMSIDFCFLVMSLFTFPNSLIFIQRIFQLIV